MDEGRTNHKRPRLDEDTESLSNESGNKYSVEAVDSAGGGTTSDSDRASDSDDDPGIDDSEIFKRVLELQRHGVDPRDVLEFHGVDREQIEDLKLSESNMWMIVKRIMVSRARQLRPPPPREPISDLMEIVEAIRNASKVLVLTGAGVSTSCGIPDFRSEKTGIYARLKVDYPTLPDPTAMFSMDFFLKDQKPFFDFAAEIYPGKFSPSPSHHFIKQLEMHGKLLRNYTQNIDTLEQVAGIERIIQCHGSFNTATCLVCKYKCRGSEIEQTVMAKQIPYCPKCPPPRFPENSKEHSDRMVDVESSSEEAPLEVNNNNCNRDENVNVALPENKPWTQFSPIRQNPVMKPDIVFFGEDLPEVFYDGIRSDCDECDLVIVIGSSLNVSPVARIPDMVPRSVKQILVNRESIRMDFNAELLGNSDVILGEIACQLGWDIYEGKGRPGSPGEPPVFPLPEPEPASVKVIDERDGASPVASQTYVEIHSDTSKNNDTCENAARTTVTQQCASTVLNGSEVDDKITTELSGVTKDEDAIENPPSSPASCLQPVPVPMRRNGETCVYDFFSPKTYAFSGALLRPRGQLWDANQGDADDLSDELGSDHPIEYEDTSDDDNAERLSHEDLSDTVSKDVKTTMLSESMN